MDAKLFFGDIRGRDPLMVDPKAVIDISRSEKIEEEIPDLLHVNSKVRIRKEYFGGIAKMGSNVVYLNEVGFNTLRDLMRYDIFSWKEYCFKVEKKDVKEFLLRMIHGEFLKKGGPESV